MQHNSCCCSCACTPSWKPPLRGDSELYSRVTLSEVFVFTVKVYRRSALNEHSDAFGCPDYDVGGCSSDLRFADKKNQAAEARQNRSGNDGRLQLSVAVLHVLEHGGQFRERNFPGDEIAGADFSARDGFESFPHELRCVMKCRFDRDLGIVQSRGIELHVLSSRAATEKIYRAALARHLHSPLPSNRRAHRFNHSVRAASAIAQFTDEFHGILDLADVKRSHCA